MGPCVQEALCKDLCSGMGFAANRGGNDASAHPFACGARPQYGRIAAECSKDIRFEGIVGAIREAGHALHEQGRNKKGAGFLPRKQCR